MHSLGESARVSIDPETVAEAEKPLAYSKKRELRRESIVAYIESKPYGTRINLKEFQRVAFISTSANTYAFVGRMIKDGIIYKHEISPRTFFYTVAANQKVVHPADKVDKPPLDVKPAPPPAPKTPIVENNLRRKAQQFSWAYPENHNDLREFIKWMESQG